MKFASFTRLGRPGFGIASDVGIIDLTGRLAPGVDSLRQCLAAGLVPAAQAYARQHGPDLGWSDVSLLPVVPDPAKILCIGLNYETHRSETKRPEAAHPAVFLRYADSQIAHGADMIRPARSEKLDYEGELAVVIGKGGRNIPEAEAMAHVAGYACYNDGTARDYQRHTHQFTPGKTFPGTGGFGPVLVTADEIPDYRNLKIETRLNGETMQSATLADLIFPLPRIIAYLSEFTPLSPGDVIATGTPGGVGDRRDPPLYMKDGDLIEVEISSVGLLRNQVRDEASPV
ncbi:fumarylacetoacetate hydrolase family protein [Arenibacterium sp. LLYu02]|uniref:fumarylacetoacetate hydrolase family protein n=1 Tax=Arenibacterium sp. LLYu02 TaxID=3404132 RepID=UPI003B214D36